MECTFRNSMTWAVRHRMHVAYHKVADFRRYYGLTERDIVVHGVVKR